MSFYKNFFLAFVLIGVVACDLFSSGSSGALLTSDTTLSASLSDIALASSGVSRQIVITNTGSNTARDILVSSSAFPPGTNITSDTCNGSNLVPLASCSFEITPGASSASDCDLGTTPTSGIVSVSADNSDTVTTNVYVLNYGCVFQGGHVFIIDDTTPASGSIGGKVIAQSDQHAGIRWSSNSSDVYDGGIAIYGISEVSTVGSPDPSAGQVTGQTSCRGELDGSCNSNNIYTYYQNNAVGFPINTSFYASGLCKQTISGYSDWYLPAVCELDSGLVICPANDSLADNLPDIISDPNAGTPSTSCVFGANCINGFYWTSTQLATTHNLAHELYFESSGNSTSNVGLKSDLLKVRCARSISL